MRFELTRHAIQRYQERIEQCTYSEAWDRLKHACEISRNASDKQRQWFAWMRGRRPRDPRPDDDAPRTIVWYCQVESIYLIGHPVYRDGDEYMLIKTVLRGPNNREANRIVKKIHKAGHGIVLDNPRIME